MEKRCAGPQCAGGVDGGKTAVISLGEEQWGTLKRLAEEVRPHERGKRLVSAVSLSMFVMAIIALLPLYNLTMRMGSWVLHTAWICLTLSMILGILLIVMDYRQESAIEAAVAALRKEMDGIERWRKGPEKGSGPRETDLCCEETPPSPEGRNPDEG